MSKGIQPGGILDYESMEGMGEEAPGIEFEEECIEKLNETMDELGLNTYEKRRGYMIQLLHGDVEPDGVFNSNVRGVSDAFTLYRENAFLLDEDGDVLYGVYGGPTSVSLTRGVPEGSTVMHNHPASPKIEKHGGLSGTFSKADIVNTSKNANEVVAVGTEGTYSMRFDDDCDRNGLQARVREDASMVQSRVNRAHSKCVEREKAGYYQSRAQYWTDNNNSQLEAVHKYYNDTAKEYGAKYTFTPTTGFSYEGCKAAQERMKTKPPKGRGSKTKVRGAYNHEGKTYIAFRSNGKEYVSDGIKKYEGTQREEILEFGKYTGTMSGKTFYDWKDGKQTKELRRKRKEGIKPSLKKKKTKKK